MNIFRNFVFETSIHIAIPIPEKQNNRYHLYCLNTIYIQKTCILCREVLYISYNQFCNVYFVYTFTLCTWCTYFHFRWFTKKKTPLPTTTWTYKNKNSISVAAQVFFFVLPLRYSPSRVMLFDFHFESTFFILTLWIAIQSSAKRKPLGTSAKYLYAQHKTSKKKNQWMCE